MKCCRCKVEKSSDNFFPGCLKYRQYKCKQCCKEYQRLMYHKHKWKRKETGRLKRSKRVVLLNELKNKPCADCNKSYPACCMDFDHTRDKKYDISHLVRSDKSWKRVLEEISKCDLVCSNCHRIRTQDRNLLKIL